MRITHALLAKKSKYILVQLESMAGTGQTLERVRTRVGPKSVVLRFDQEVKEKVLFVETKKIRSLSDDLMQRYFKFSPNE